MTVFPLGHEHIRGLSQLQHLEVAPRRLGEGVGHRLLPFQECVCGGGSPTTVMSCLLCDFTGENCKASFHFILLSKHFQVVAPSHFMFSVATISSSVSYAPNPFVVCFLCLLFERSLTGAAAVQL